VQRHRVGDCAVAVKEVRAEGAWGEFQFHALGQFSFRGLSLFLLLYFAFLFILPEAWAAVLGGTGMLAEKAPRLDGAARPRLMSELKSLCGNS
jgi:hypothetical protein